METLTRKIDGYCERLGPEFWAEPVNAVTNAAFIIAALIALVIARRRGPVDPAVGWLIAVTFAVGVGSFLFHTFATVWAAMADTGPIGVFILSYFAIAMNRFAGLTWRTSLMVAVGFLLAMGAVSAALRPLIGHIAGGSQSYFPAFLALLGVGLWLWSRRHAAGPWLVAVAGVFAVSLTFRTLDRQICADWPLGTHFAWHILNAVVLGALIVAVIRHGRKPG